MKRVVAVVFRIKTDGMQLGRVFAEEKDIEGLLIRVSEGEHLKSASKLHKDPEDPNYYTTKGGELLKGTIELIRAALQEGEKVLLSFSSKMCFLSTVE